MTSEVFTLVKLKLSVKTLMNKSTRGIYIATNFRFPFIRPQSFLKVHHKNSQIEMMYTRMELKDDWLRQRATILTRTLECISDDKIFSYARVCMEDVI